MKLVKKINRVLNKIGIDIIPYHKGSSSPPIEFDEKDNFIINFVTERNLSMGSKQRCWSTLMACKYVIECGIPGDFVECGVWRGGQALIAAYVFKNYGNEKRGVRLFDTFAGMTKPDEIDYKNFSEKNDVIDTFNKNQRRNHNEWCYASLSEVKSYFSELNLLDSNIIFVEGDVLNTLSQPTNLPPMISVLRLDTDWYETTRLELETLYPNLENNGVLIIDDYGSWQGAKKAVDEYFLTHKPRPYFQVIDYTARCGIKTS